MKSIGFKKIDEGAYFVVDTTGYTSKITPFNPVVANQTISYVVSPENPPTCDEPLDQPETE